MKLCFTEKREGGGPISLGRGSSVRCVSRTRKSNHYMPNGCCGRGEVFVSKRGWGLKSTGVQKRKIAKQAVKPPTVGVGGRGWGAASCGTSERDDHLWRGEAGIFSGEPKGRGRGEKGEGRAIVSLETEARGGGRGGGGSNEGRRFST